MRKNTFRLTESQLHRMIKESVRQVLKESIDDKSIVEAFLEENEMYNAPIEWITNNKFVDAHGCDGYIFNSEDDAINSLMNGDNYQNAIDYVNTSQSEEEWVRYLINGGVKPQIANSIIQNQDWDKVIEIIIDTVGPEWFLSQYSGEVHELPNGKLLYY